MPAQFGEAVRTAPSTPQCFGLQRALGKPELQRVGQRIAGNAVAHQLQLLLHAFEVCTLAMKLGAVAVRRGQLVEKSTMASNATLRCLSNPSNGANA